MTIRERLKMPIVSPGSLSFSGLEKASKLLSSKQAEVMRICSEVQNQSGVNNALDQNVDFN
jgi:hypothetical protein